MKYKNIEITLNERTTKFEATIGGQTVVAPSFDSMKGKIDKAEKATFNVRPALFHRSYHGDTLQITECRIVGIKVIKRKWNSDRYEFILEYGKGAKTTVASSIPADTPSNRAALQAIFDLHKKQEAMRDAMRAELGEAENKVEYLSPETYK